MSTQATNYTERQSEVNRVLFRIGYPFHHYSVV